MAKYRIQTDNYSGFEVVAWRWWFPFWVQIGGCNTHITEVDAIDFLKSQVARKPRKKIIKQYNSIHAVICEK